MYGWIYRIYIKNIWIDFEVYPVQDYKRLSGESGTCYINKEDEPNGIEEFDEGVCLMKMKGSFCWRGMWEGRLYFTDEEYWDEELTELCDLYNNHIEVWCKEFIKSREPDRNYD